MCASGYVNMCYFLKSAIIGILGIYAYGVSRLHFYIYSAISLCAHLEKFVSFLFALHNRFNIGVPLYQRQKTILLTL